MCLLQKRHLPCLFGARVDKILCSSRGTQDSLYKIGIFCNAKEGSNVSNSSFPLGLPLQMFAKDLLPPFHSGSAACHTQYLQVRVVPVVLGVQLVRQRLFCAPKSAGLLSTWPPDTPISVIAGF